jgi:hypothetical protein
MYEDTTLGLFPKDDPSFAPASFKCGSVTMVRQPITAPNHFEYIWSKPVDNQPCFSITFDKAKSDGKSRVDGSGFNICGDSPRRVERTLEVKY